MKKDFSNHTFLEFDRLFMSWLAGNFSTRFIDDVFDYNFRLLFCGDGYLADRNIRKIIRRNSLNYLWLTLFYFTIFFFGLFKSDAIFLRSKSTSLEFSSDLKRELKLLGYRVYGSLSIFNKRDYFEENIFTGAVAFDFFERSLCIIRRIKTAKCTCIEDIFKLRSDKSFCDGFNRAFIKDVARAEKMIKVMKIQGILLHTDQTAVSIIFCIAAKNLGIPFGVLGHGDFRSKPMISVLPLRADKIFVFTSYSFTNLASNLPRSKVGLLENLKIGILKSKTPCRKLVVASSPFYIYDNEEKIEIFKKSFQNLKLNWPDYELVYCAHPLEKDPNIKIYLEKIGFRYVSGQTHSEAQTAAIVVGGHSSFLFECAVNSIPVFQIKEHCINPLERLIDDVPQLASEKIVPNLIKFASRSRIEFEKSSNDVAELCCFLSDKRQRP